MVGLAGVAEDDAEKFAVALHEIELRVKDGGYASLQALGPSEQRGADGILLILNGFVIGLNDGFFAREIVIGGAFGDFGAAGDFLHSGGIEAFFAEELQSAFKNVAAGLFRFVGGALIFDHVQILNC